MRRPPWPRGSPARRRAPRSLPASSGPPPCWPRPAPPVRRSSWDRRRSLTTRTSTSSTSSHRVARRRPAPSRAGRPGILARKGRATTLRRSCFLLQVDPELLDASRARHARVWPDMLRALRAAGWYRYSLYLRDDGLLVGCVEAEDLAAAQAAMAATEVNARWKAEMGHFFTGLDGGRPDEGLLVLEEIFNLEDQLMQLELTPNGEEAP